MGVRLRVRTALGQPLDDDIGYAFEQTRIVIGRGAGADVRIPHLSVSERHALLLPDGVGYAIEDAGSTNGTRVNGNRLTPGRRKLLRDGDRIEVGAYELSFHTGALVTEAVTVERTAELARRLFRKTQGDKRLAQPRLVVIAGSATGKSLVIPAPPARLTLGRAAGCQLVLTDEGIEDEHLEVTRDLDGVLLNALAQGALPRPTQRLRDGDEIHLGACKLLFEEPADEPLAALQSQPDMPMPAEATAAATAEAAAPPTKPEADPRSAETGQVKARRGPGLDADLIIYALAAVVLAVSVAGLFALMGE